MSAFTDFEKAAWSDIVAAFQRFEQIILSGATEAETVLAPVATSAVSAVEVAASAALTQVAGQVTKDATASVTDEIAKVAGTVIGVAAKAVL